MKIFLLCLLSALPLSLVAQEDDLQALQQGLEVAERTGNRDTIATAYAHLSEYYAYRRTDSTRYYCRQGLKHARKDRQDPYLTLLINYAVTYATEGDMDEAVRQLSFADREAVRLQAPTEYRVAILTSLGVGYRRKEMPDSALYCYNRALQVLEENGDYDDRTHLLTSIAVLYANTSRLDEAAAYARRAMDAAAHSDDIDMVFYAATTAGAIFQLQGKNGEAARMLRPAIDKARSQQKPMFELKGLVYLIKCFADMGQADSLDYYMAQAELVKKRLPETANEVLGYEETHYQLLTRLGRYRESLAVQQKLFALREVNAQTPLDRLYRDMAANYEGLKDYARAARYYEKAYLTADSLHLEQVNADLSEWSVKYETQEKELEIAHLTQEQLKQEARTWQWMVVASVLLFVFLCWVLYYFLRRKRLRKEEELRLAQRYIEGMERERSRLAKELHDGVCNDLLGIGMQVQARQAAGQDDNGRLLEMIGRVRDDVRHISHELMPPKFQYVTLPEAVADYVSRLVAPPSMQLAFKSVGTEEQWGKVPDQVSYEVYRIVQELLSNIVRHSDATEVEVSLALEKEVLKLELADNGSYQYRSGQRTDGIGMDTVNERVTALGGAFAVESTGSGCACILTVQLA